MKLIAAALLLTLSACRSPTEVESNVRCNLTVFWDAARVQIDSTWANCQAVR